MRFYSFFLWLLRLLSFPYHVFHRHSYTVLLILQLQTSRRKTLQWIVWEPRGELALEERKVRRHFCLSQAAPKLLHPRSKGRRGAFLRIDYFLLSSSSPFLSLCLFVFFLEISFAFAFAFLIFSFLSFFLLSFFYHFTVEKGFLFLQEPKKKWKHFFYLKQILYYFHLW